MIMKQEWPDPNMIEQAADEALLLPVLSDYVPAIMKLRARGWSDRKIAKWLTEHGVPATFNQVYYARRDCAAKPEDDHMLDESIIKREMEEDGVLGVTYIDGFGGFHIFARNKEDMESAIRDASHEHELKHIKKIYYHPGGVVMSLETPVDFDVSHWLKAFYNTEHADDPIIDWED